MTCATHGGEQHGMFGQWSAADQLVGREVGTGPLVSGQLSLQSAWGIMGRSLALGAGRHHERLLKDVSNLMTAREMGLTTFYSWGYSTEKGGGGCVHFGPQCI